jgi:hypothetical protein
MGRLANFSLRGQGKGAQSSQVAVANGKAAAPAQMTTDAKSSSSGNAAPKSGAAASSAQGTTAPSGTGVAGVQPLPVGQTNQKEQPSGPGRKGTRDRATVLPLGTQNQTTPPGKPLGPKV